MSIDSHSSKPCFSVEFVDTYSIHSFPPPSRRTQQIQPFSQSGAGVSPMGKASLLCCYCLKRVRPFCRRLTVYDCHSFHSQPRQFRRGPSSQLSSSHSQLQPSLVQTSVFHSPTIISQPIFPAHTSHISPPRP